MMVLAIVSQAELEAIDVAEACRQISRCDESDAYAPRNDLVKKAAAGSLSAGDFAGRTGRSSCGVVRDMPRPAGANGVNDDPANGPGAPDMSGPTASTAYRRIAVPLDSTAESEQALRWGMAVAQRAGCPLELVHTTIQPPVAPEAYGAPGIPTEAVEQARAAALERLHRLAGDIAALGVRTEATVLDGEVATSLAEHFRTTGVDLIVMTTHDRGRLEHLLMGSVAEAVTRKAHIPVLVVRPSTGPASFEPPVIEHMLIPLDGSDFAEAILPHASTLARLMRTRITLLAVLQPILAIATAALDAGPDPVTPLPGVPNGVAHGEVRAPELERAAAILRSSTSVPVETAVLSDGRPARAIVGYADRHAVDLIAMTTHGRGALKRLVAGSVSEEVVRTSRLPMLLVRPEITPEHGAD